MKVTGKFVEDVRKKLGIPQGRLAKESGIHQSTLSRIESDADEPVNDKYWNQLRDAFFNLKVSGLDLADRSRETEEQVFVRKADDGSVAIVSLQASANGSSPQGIQDTKSQTNRDQSWVPFSCRLAGGPEVAKLEIKGALTASELDAVKRWLRKVEAAAEAFAEVEAGDRANG